MRASERASHKKSERASEQASNSNTNSITNGILHCALLSKGSYWSSYNKGLALANSIYHIIHTLIVTPNLGFSVTMYNYNV